MGAGNSFANSVAPATSSLTVEGDSLSQGAAWVTSLAASLPLWLVVNAATSGNTLADMVTQYPTQVAPYYSAVRGANIVIYWGGTNDNTASASAATILSRMASYYTLAHATGQKVITTTMLPAESWSGAQDAVQAAVNVGLRAAAVGTYFDVLVDLQAIPELQNASDVAIYLDGTHLSVMAQNTYVFPAMQAGVAAVVNPTAQLGTLASQNALSAGPITFATSISMIDTNSFLGIGYRIVDSAGALRVNHGCATNAAGGYGFTRMPAEGYVFVTSAGGFGLYFNNTTWFFGNQVSLTTQTPASAAAAGVAGTVTWDANFMYVCTATNTWKRVAIATW